MRIIFMGTPEFAVASLDALIKSKFEVVAVVTAPDKPAGRGQVLSQSAVKHYALEHQLQVLQPVNLKDELFLEQLKHLNADLQVVVAFRMLPERVWNMPRLGTYNLHASLLPKYRGAAPINWAIIHGEKETGVSTFKLVHEIDAGNILFQEKVNILENTTAGQLHDQLMNIGASLVVKTVHEIQLADEQEKKLPFITQDISQICHAPKLFKHDCKIHWDNPVKSIYNLIRGLSPYPTAFTELRGVKGEILVLKIFEAKYEEIDHQLPNGSLLTDGKNFLKVHAKGGIIAITDLQLQGKKRMLVEDFLRGFKMNEYLIVK